MGNNDDRRPIVWEGIFDTREDAVAMGNGFRSELWLSRIEEQLSTYLERIETLGKNALPPRPCALPLFCALIKPRVVVDVGGGSGWSWHCVQQSAPDSLPDQWFILELSEVCEHFSKSSYPPSSSVKYISTVRPDLGCDLVYSNSALQYMIDDEVFLDSVDTMEPMYILLEDFLGGDFEDFFSVQIFREHRLPVKFRNREAFLKKLNGYQVLASERYVSMIMDRVGPLPMSNFPLDKQIEFGETMLLRKIESLPPC